jgi:hypothetical protein
MSSTQALSNLGRLGSRIGEAERLTEIRRGACHWRWSLLFACVALLCESSAVVAAERYIPDGPDVPTIVLNEGQSGAAGLPPLSVPPPKQWDQQSIWNMQVVGFQDNQGRASSDDGWIENQNGRHIAYVANSPGSALNPLTGQDEKNGTSLVDVTDPRHPVFLSHIPAPSGGGATHLAVCGGSTLPHGQKDHWYLLRHDGQTNQEVWDVTNPKAPTRLTVLISGLTGTHHDWWECDTGIAYTISETTSDGWRETGSHQHVYIYDLSDPAKPVFIRQFGLVGQQPDADIGTAKSCINAPGPNCYEGVTNPPGGVHQIYSAGTSKNRVYLAYGVDENGVFQILDRQKLLEGCKIPTASPQCPTRPTQADLLYPQVGYVTTNPNQGGHTAIPIFGVPVPEAQQNYLDGKPQRWDLLAVTSEETTNDCLGQPWKNPTLLDITDDRAPWPIAVLDVGQFPGNFCAKGSRFGVHELNRQIYPPFYGRLVIAAMFNAGLQVWDIRDPYNPRRVAYFIQAPNKNTHESCGSYQGNQHYCRKAIFSDLGEVDDRGYIYNFDRAGSGLTILTLTGAAAQVATAKPGTSKP